MVLLLSSLVWWSRVTASKRRAEDLEREVERRTAELERLGRLTEAINEAVTVEEVLDHLYDNFEGLVPYDRIGLALLDEDRIVLRAVWSRGSEAPTGIDRGYAARLDESSSLRETLESGRPRLISDLEAYLKEHPESESTQRILQEGIRSSLTCPLKALGQPVGFIFFSSFEADKYNQSHAEFLEKVAGHLSLIVGKSRLYDDLVHTKARLEQANRDLEHLATTDSLTGVANRRVFDDRLDAEWRRAQRSREPLTLLMIDVDHFKLFNDRHGHKAGDQCLRSIASALSQVVRRASDLIARYGGEEFTVVLPQCGRDEGVSIAESLRRAVEAMKITHPDCQSGVVSVSIGVATIVPQSDSYRENLLEQADLALYEAKRRGRNRIVSHDELTGAALGSDE